MAWEKVNQLFQRRDTILENKLRVEHMRQFLIFGLPLDVNGVRYANILDRKQEQKDILGEF